MLTEKSDTMTIWSEECESPTSVYSHFNTPTNKHKPLCQRGVYFESKNEQCVNTGCWCVYVVWELVAFHFPTANYAFYNNYQQSPWLNDPKSFFLKWQSLERTMIFNFHLYGRKGKCATFLLPPHMPVWLVCWQYHNVCIGGKC